MSSPTPDSVSPIRTTGVTSTSSTTPIQGKKPTGAVDSLAKASKDQFVTPPSLDKPTLSAGAPSQNAEALAALSIAFAAYFNSMARSSEVSSGDVVTSQTLVTSESQSVLQSTTLSVQKQQAAIREYEKIQEEQDNPWFKIFGDIFMAIMAVVLVATIVSAVVSGGSTLAAVPEELEGMGAGMGAIEGAESSSESIAMTTMTTTLPEATTTTTAETSFMEAGSASEEGAGEAAGESAGTAAGSTSTAAETVAETQAETAEELTQGASKGLSQAASEESAAEDETVTQAAKEAAKKGMSTAMKVTIGAALGGLAGGKSLVDAIQNFELKGTYDDYAKLQKQVGDAMSQQQAVTMLYKYINQGLQRTSNLANSQIGAGSQSLKEFSDILQAYAQIAQQASQAAKA